MSDAERKLVLWTIITTPKYGKTSRNRVPAGWAIFGIDRLTNPTCMVKFV